MILLRSLRDAQDLVWSLRVHFGVMNSFRIWRSWKVPMLHCRLRDEFVGCDFRDERLSKRILKLADVFENNPGRSIPAAFVTRSDWEACYRFFDNDEVTPSAIMKPHIEATRERVRCTHVALLVQDTTELDLTRPNQQVIGAGPMNAASRRGAFVHPLIAFRSDGVPLGLVGMQCWAREGLREDGPRIGRTKREAKPIEEKESYRWLVGLHQAQETAEACPQTSCICIGDSESDIYEFFTTAQRLRSQSKNLHFLVRAAQDRATKEGDRWTAVVRKTPLIATQSVFVRERKAKLGIVTSDRAKSRTARTAEVGIRACKLTVVCPDHISGAPKSVVVNAVLVEESNPPADEPAIRWLLITTLPIDNSEQIQTVIRHYCVRWQIEVYFRTLKSGCRIEQRRLETLDRMMNCVALMMVVAWRVAYVSYLGRTCPDMSCEAVFEPCEWKSVYAVLNRKIPDHGCPKLQEVVRAIATLGGFVDRTGHEPGTQTVWTGLQRCYDLSTGWNAFGPGAKKFFSS